MTLTVKTLSLGMLALALAAVVACSPEKPATPTYAKDVSPILEAHCNRCHSGRGPDGGFLGDPGANPPTPTLCHLDSYDGASGPCALLMLPYINQGPGSKPMPPPPATKLDDWEIDVIERWAMTKPAPPP